MSKRVARMVAAALALIAAAALLSSCSGKKDAPPSESPLPPTPTQAATPTPTPEPPFELTINEADLPLKEGQKNESIKQMQLALIALGYLDKEATGFFGAETKKCVVKFQKDSGLTDDGVVGSSTIEKIKEALAK